MTKKFVSNNQQLIFEIWDTAGQERYKSIMPLYYRNADAIIIVFDLTCQNSFHEAAEWLHRVTQTQISNSTPIILVGNKTDQLGREIDNISIQQFVNDHNLTYFETSAKTGDNVNEIFSWIASKVHRPVEEQLFSVPVTHDYNCVSRNSCC
jgi:small GTP-binding protein